MEKTRLSSRQDSGASANPWSQWPNGMSSVLTITSMKLLKTMGTSQTTRLENNVPVSCHNGGQRYAAGQLLSAYKHLSEFRGESQMSTWLTAIVCNSARMRLRARSRRQHLSLDDRIGEEKQYSVSERLTYHGPSPEEACRGSELATRVAALLPHLSPSLRKAFELRDLNGLTTTEAAQILGVAEGTLKAQLSRARIKLRNLIVRMPDRQLPRASTKTNQFAHDKPWPSGVRAIRPTFVTPEQAE